MSNKKLVAPDTSTQAGDKREITGSNNAGETKRGLDVNILNPEDISSGGTDRLLEVDTTSTANTTYVGCAVLGSATSAAVWKIKRYVNSSGDVTKTYADGDADFDNIWDNRTGLSYS